MTDGSGSNRTVVEHLEEIGVVPVVTIDHSAQAADLGAALLAGGIPCAEITFRTAAAPRAIEQMAAAHPELLVGAGTVLDVEQARQASEAGARFLMGPALDEEVVGWCQSRGVLIVPGAMSPTEMHRAARSGLELVKFFPADVAGGPPAVRSLAAVFPQMRFVPTGGIDATNFSRYLELPSVAACGGSWLTPRELIDEGDFNGIEQLVAQTAAAVRAVRGRD